MRVRSIPVEAWPPDDREALNRACTAGGPLDESGRAAHWSKATLRNRTRAFGTFLQSLILENDLDPAETLPNRVSRSRITKHLDRLCAARSANSVRQVMLDLSFFLAAVAPQIDWRWVRKMPLMPTAREAMASRVPKIRIQPEQIIGPALARLAELGAGMMTAEGAAEATQLTLIVLAFYTKMRLRNVLGLRLGESLLIDERCIRLRIPENATKTGMAIETKVGGRAEAALRAYVSYARPALLADRPDEGDLWLRSDGRPINRKQVGRFFSQAGQRFLGRHITPHLVRHTYATTMQLYAPREVYTAASGLSHRGVTTFLQSYDQSACEVADQEWRRLLKRARRDNS
ncbi:MAG: tyrosine-type recombinase/integrase [Hyphomicrobiaceae bacterium]